ncbi:MAG: CHASE3 domain-containing protein [Pseudomonadota bacterium]
MKKKSVASIPLYITALFVICLVTLAGSAVSSYQNLQKLKQNNDWMEHGWSVKDHLKNINLLIMDAESSLRGYYLSDDPTYLRPWKAAKDKLESEFIILNKLVQDNPAQVKNLAQLRLQFDRKMKKFEESTALFKDGGLIEVANAIKLGDGRDLMDEIRLQDIIMEKEELELLTARRDRFYQEYNGALWISNAINGVAMLILMLFYRLIGRSFAKQRAVEDALKLANDNLETTVLARTEQLSVLSRHLLKVSEEEKSKLARELHDEMGASLTAISMDLSMVTEKLKKTEPALATQLLRAKQALLDTVDLKRRIIEDLRPSMLDNLGLTASIQNHCQETARLAGLAYEADISEDFDNIDPTWAIALFRITQESLNNVIKYAKASHVKVTLKRQANGLWLQILDDGVGIPKDALKKHKSHGLLGMRERALLLGGSFTVKPGAANRGTSIEAFLPFPH